MKTMIAALAIVLLMTVVTSANDLTSWTLWSRDADNSVEQRIGLDTDPVEFGVLGRWWPIDSAPQVAGGYVFLHLPQPIEVDNPFKDLIPGLPDTFLGYAYGGGSFGIDLLDGNTQKGFSAWQAGVLVSGEENTDVALIFEWARYDYKDNLGAAREDEDVLSFGLRIKF